MGTGSGGEEPHLEPCALRCQHVSHVRSLDSLGYKLSTLGGFGRSLDGGEEHWQVGNHKASTFMDGREFWDFLRISNPKRQDSQSMRK